MSSKAVVAVLLSLTAISQIASSHETGQTQPVTKVAYSVPVVAQAKLQKNVVVKGYTPAVALPPATPLVSGANTLEPRTTDSNEQFTRMSCCP